jgi:autotransporter-associated beta strand protein
VSNPNARQQEKAMKNGFGGILKRFGGESSTSALNVRRSMLCVLFLSAAGAAWAANVLTFQRTPDTYVSTTGRVSGVAYTIEFWMRPTTNFDPENQIYTQDNTGDGRIFMSVWSGKPTLQISGTRKSANTNLTLNTWYHYACARDTSGTVRMYIDGTLVMSEYYNAHPPLTPYTTSIGLLVRAKNGFRGDLADVRLWNAVRSQAEIQANMHLRLSGTETGLAHYWPFDEGTGATVYDRAGNADGTITGAAWNTNPDLPITTEAAGSWIAPSDGAWSNPANWLNAAPAQGTDISAFFTNDPPTAVTVNNDVSGLAIGNLTVYSAQPFTFTGHAVAFTNSFSPSVIATTNGGHTLALPLELSPPGLVASATSPGALSFTDAISGPGGFTANPAPAGGGTVTLAAANTYTGPTVSGSGTLAVSSLADGGLPSAIGASSADPASLVLGPGTLRYTGPSATVDRGLTVNAGSRKAAILSLDSDLTLTGPITNVAGAFIKAGPGTLTYASPAASLIGRQQSSNLAGQAPYPANGDSPANGFGCFTVADGKVVLGAHPAQTNLFNEEVTVGAYTTDQPGQETTGELEFVGGYTRFNTLLDIGYYNGTSVSAPVPLQPTVTVSGGTVSANGLIIAFGYNYFGTAYPNTRAVLNIAGGTFTVDDQIRFGDQRGDPDSPMHATINLTGGTFRHASATYGLQMGWRSPSAADATLNIAGGLFDEYADVRMAMNGNTSVVRLDGGTLRMRNITHNSTNGISLLTLNGGILQPRMPGYTLRGLTAATVSTNGAVIDTSLASYTIAQDLLHDPGLGASPDGGLTKTGAHPLTLSFTNATYTGTTAVNEGELRIGGNATQTVSLAALVVAPGAALGFTFKPDGSSNDRLVVAEPPELATGSLIALILTGTELPFTKNGIYTLITYAGADPAVSGLACANPVPGKTYTFAASAGALTVEVASDASAAVWKTDADGAWSTAANWTAAPAPGAPARFDDAITAPRTVATAGQTAGGLYFNNANAYTLSGSGLNLTSGAEIAVEQGSHTVDAPLTLADSAAVTFAPGTALTLSGVSGASLAAQGNGTLNLTAAPALDALALDGSTLGIGGSFAVVPPVALAGTVTVAPAANASAELSGEVSGTANLIKAGASTLTLSGANTCTGVTSIDNGTLSIPWLSGITQPSPLGKGGNAADFLIGAGTFRYTGPSNAVQRGLTLAAPQNRAAVIRVDEGSDLTLSGWINSTSGSFVKTGPGTLRFAQPHTSNKLMTHASPNESTRLNIGSNGEGPTTGFSGVSVVDGKLALGAPGQTNTLARIFVGLWSSDLPGGETAGELELTDGMLLSNNGLLAVGRNNGTTTTAPAGLSSRLTVRGGVITNFNHLSLGYRNAGPAGYNARPMMEMSGGTVSMNNFFISETSGSKSTVTITGGIVRPIVSANFAMAANTEALFTLGGDALFETVGNFDLSLGNGNSATAVATLRLNGGTLCTRNITKAASAQGTVWFNGGTLKPRASGQTLQNLTAAYSSTNGAVFDTSLAAYTVAQNLLHDPALGIDSDGGLLKLGTNTLSLTSAANTFNGPVRVSDGLLRARLGGTNDLYVAAGAAFDALGERCTVGDLAGSGLLTNGVIAVTGTLDPGTNGAPAGASMTVQNLALAAGATVAAPWVTNALGQVANDFTAVTGTLAPEGPGFFDLGRTEENPIPMPFSLTVFSYGTLSGSFAGWKAVGTGLPAGKATATVVTAANGLVTLSVRYGGTVLMLQ